MWNRWYFNNIEGLHDAVGTLHVHDVAHLLVCFCTERCGEKQPKLLELLIYFLEGFEISSGCVCWHSCHSVAIGNVIWTKWTFAEHVVILPPCAESKPTWRSQVWWFAKFARYDVTWKPSIFFNLQFSTY